jgi:hypothetical protein
VACRARRRVFITFRSGQEERRIELQAQRFSFWP